MVCGVQLKNVFEMLELCLDIKKTEAGCDEAGRGCLAGPVFAAAVILPADLDTAVLKELNDSKKMSEKARYDLRPVIEQTALSYSVASVNEKEIDEINILNASFLAMHRAIDGLKIIPNHLVIDGNRFKRYKNIQHTCIIKGDGKYLNIAAASVLAKTCRDDLMNELHEKYPHYNWKKNKAYATETHRKAIETFGPCEFHRRSFRLLPSQLSFQF